MRLALAQINTTVGDLDGNREKILQGLAEARAASADLVLFPELAVTGYPPEDLLLRPGFVRAAAESLRELARETRGLSALVGFPHFDGDLYNACAVCTAGAVKAIYRKRFLPNYGVFDENLQARVRGHLLMGLSNKFGWLVVATGNKSELSVGYATLYGDLAGGFALLKDVFKTDVFRLARYVNERAGEGGPARPTGAASSSASRSICGAASCSSTRTRWMRSGARRMRPIQAKMGSRHQISEPSSNSVKP